MSDLNDTLRINVAVLEEVQFICDNIKQNIVAAGKHVSGELSDSPRPRISGSTDNIRIEIETAPYFGTIETGRKPTPGIPPSAEMIENIGDWAESVGMDREAAWPIAVNIQEKGTQLWRDGGRDDIYSQFFTKEYWGRVTERVSKVAAKNYAMNLRKAIKPKK